MTEDNKIEEVAREIFEEIDPPHSASRARRLKDGSIERSRNMASMSKGPYLDAIIEAEWRGFFHCFKRKLNEHFKSMRADGILIKTPDRTTMNADVDAALLFINRASNPEAYERMLKHRKVEASHAGSVYTVKDAEGE